MKVLFGSIVVDARGRLNGHVFKKTSFGNSVSALALPRSQSAWMLNTALQRNSWLFRQWNNLPLAKRNFANQFAANNPLPNAFGVLRNIGGRAMFVKMSSVSQYPALQISDPYGWEAVSPNAQWSVLGVNAVTGVLSLEIDMVEEFAGFAVYAQQCSSSRIVPPNNRWRRFENMTAEGVGIINSVGSVFSVTGTPRSNSAFWVKVIIYRSGGWQGETVIVKVALD